MTRSAVNIACIDRPNKRSENRSSTTATYSRPSHLHVYVNSTTHCRWAAAAVRARYRTFGAVVCSELSPLSDGSDRRRVPARRAALSINPLSRSRPKRCPALRSSACSRRTPNLGSEITKLARRVATIAVSVLVRSATESLASGEPRSPPAARGGATPSRPARSVPAAVDHSRQVTERWSDDSHERRVSHRIRFGKTRQPFFCEATSPNQR